MTITAEMQRAIERARHNGGKLKRLVGGYWIGVNDSVSGGHFSTRTVEALVSRGVMIYSAKRSGRNGEFPVEATLKEIAQKVGAEPVIGTRRAGAARFSKGAREAIADLRGVTDETPARSIEREPKRIGDLLPGLDA
jgi:hypothetical protein